MYYFQKVRVIQKELANVSFVTKGYRHAQTLLKTILNWLR